MRLIVGLRVDIVAGDAVGSRVALDPTYAVIMALLISARHSFPKVQLLTAVVYVACELCRQEQKAVSSL